MKKALLSILVTLLITFTIPQAIASQVTDDTEITQEDYKPTEQKNIFMIPINGLELYSLIQACHKAGNNAPKLCQAYQAGVITGSHALAQFLGAPVPFCLSNTITDKEIDYAILAHIEEIPDLEKMPASAAVIITMTDLFPCEQTKEENNQ